MRDDDTSARSEREGGARGRSTASLPRLCAITDRALAGGIPHDEIVEALVRGGARWIQLREKRLGPGAFLAEAKRAVVLGRDAGAIVVVNDRVDVAMAAGADGVHVGREDLPARDARALMGSSALIGVSTHSVEEGIAAASLPVDYVALGPVFPTSSKPDAEPAVGVDSIRRLARAIPLPVVAIGGIGPGNAREVLDAGAAAVAVISCLYGRRPIEDRISSLLAILSSA